MSRTAVLSRLPSLIRGGSWKSPVGPPAAGSPAGAWLSLGDRQQLHISEREGRPHDDAHFALVVDDFDAVLVRISSAGAMWQDQEDVFGGRRGFTRDPAGNRIEVLEASGELSPQ